MTDRRLHVAKSGMEASVKTLYNLSRNGKKLEVDAATLKLDLVDKKPKPKSEEQIQIAPRRWAGRDGKFTRLIRTKRQITEDAVAYVSTSSMSAFFCRGLLSLRARGVADAVS